MQYRQSILNDWCNNDAEHCCQLFLHTTDKTQQIDEPRCQSHDYLRILFLAQILLMINQWFRETDHSRLGPADAH